MKRTNALVAIAFLFGSLTSPLVALAADGQGFWCSLFGWAVRPFGWCEITEVVEVVIDKNTQVAAVIGHQPFVSGVSTNSDDAQLIAFASTSQPITYETVTNEYITIEQTGVTPEMLDRRTTELLMYINSLSHGQATVVATTSEGLSTREYVLKSVDRVYEVTSDARRDILVQAEFTSPTLSDAVLSGTTYASGWFGVGTSSPSDVLSVSGAIYLGSAAPSNITNRLYNVSGDLYWNGSILSGSSTANWSAVAGDVFRLTGNVGIGTSTPGDTLTIAGTLSAGTTTARIVDTGGEVCNVEAYGAVGDNATLNDAAIAAAIAACGDGGTVYFPMGQYRIANPIVLDRPITLRGAYSPRWSYSSTPRSSIRADFGSFSGAALIHVRDRTISGEVDHNNGGRIEYLSLDGGSASTDVDGIYFEGLVRDWKLTDVDISQVTGNGFEAAVGAGSGNPRGFTIRGLSIYSSDGHGFRATALNDSYVEDLLSVGNALRGIYLSSIGETKFNNSRAVFNGLTGLYIDGSSANGGLMFTDFSTDRNDRHGVRISLTGTTTVTFNGLLTRRDGANTSAGTETPYAGLAVIGTSSAQVAPVFVNGLTQIVGVDDAGAPPLAPLVGVRVTNASYVKVDGQLWGVTAPYQDDGGNGHFIIAEDSILKTGIVGITEAVPTLFHDKFIATTSGLYYDGRVSIGSTTGSRLFNITAPAQAGARFHDTTNDVIFDMRAEDYQGFFGTFSNHQLRFQTNNLSRLTIDTDGDIGIGTTSPDSELDVIGTIQSSDLLGGATTLTTDANGNIIRNPSDRRLKTNITDIGGALEMTLALRGVRYQWLDEERFGEQMEIGFIAQEVDKVVPEAVRKGGDYWSLNTQNLIAVVVEGMKEMWQTVTGNQAKIAELEERLAEVEAELGLEQPVVELELPSGTEIETMSPSSEVATTTISSTEELVAPAATTTESAAGLEPVVSEPELEAGSLDAAVVPTAEPTPAEPVVGEDEAEEDTAVIDPSE
ncbi:tail fiber domain-containing protein [Candidatus Nomurabacteria bacterium]|nr:tail fiber domain-containing protein [Candidatus Nomurabacteria bacterium]